jgi:hypothetical protein
MVGEGHGEYRTRTEVLGAVTLSTAAWEIAGEHHKHGVRGDRYF